MADPLGISTGQGKGRAQVFGDTYNDYFAEKVKKGTEEKKVQQEELAKLQAADGLWDRDNELFKPKIEELRKYYRENARNIIKGDFDATTNLEAMKNDLTQFVGSSKSSKKFYEETLKLVNQNPQDYSKATKERLSSYAKEGGRFDSDLKLDPSFDPNESFKSMSQEVKNLGMKYGDWKINGAGDMYTSTGEQSVDMVKSILDSQIDSDIQQRGEEASDYWNQPGVYEKKLEELENTVSRDVKSKMKQVPREPWGATKIKNQADRRKILINNVKYNTKEALAELGNLKGQKNRDSGSTLTDIRVLEPGERGALNRTVYVEYDDGSVDYMDVTDKGFNTEFNAFISSTGESEKLSDDDLSQVPDADIPEGYSIPKGKGAMLSNDLNNLMSGDDLDDRLKGYTNRVVLSKSIFSKSLRSKIGDPLTTSDSTDKISGLLTDVFSGKNYKGGKVQKITYEDNSVDPDEYKVVYLDSKGKEQEVLIKATDKEGVAELSGMKKTKGTKVVVEDVSLTPEQIKSVREANPDATKDMSDDEILESYKSQ